MSGSGAGSLAARITDPKAPPTGPASHRKQRRAAQVAQALIKSELRGQKPGGGQQQQQNGQPFAGNGSAPTTTTATSFNKGITIRGLAGPFVVMAQNFAPGTTAADIESAMTPVGGIIISCRLLKQHPIVIAEIVFESKQGADNVIATFNNQTVRPFPSHLSFQSPPRTNTKLVICKQADGRVLSVYAKPGNTPTPLRPSADDPMVVDGSWGFEDPIETTTTEYRPVPPVSAAAAAPSGLYSDNIVKPNRWGRGFNRSGRFGLGGI
jgi:hypothetical protein